MSAEKELNTDTSDDNKLVSGKPIHCLESLLHMWSSDMMCMLSYCIYVFRSDPM